MRYLTILLIFLVGFTFSCGPTVTEGRRIDAAKVRQMAPGDTQVGKVEEMFGKPTKIEKLPTGEEDYVYIYKTAEPHWWTLDKVSGQQLNVLVKDGIVQTWKLRTEGKEVVLKE
jgi:outer membrane protein assembly factor BamE (lipoprotein component of BamABCDE complex)